MTKYNEQAQFIKETLNLTLNIQAIKFIEDPKDVPENAINCKDAYGHLSICQALALTKREGKTVYSPKEAEWCWSPVVGLGYAKCEPGTPVFEELSRFLFIENPEQAKAFLERFPRLPYGKYCGVLIAPATEATFEPDVFLISCSDNFQFRSLIGAVKFKTGKRLDVSLEMVDSCAYTFIESMFTKKITVAAPDPGEQERALANSNEMIMGVPKECMDMLVEGLKFFSMIHMGYKEMHPMKGEDGNMIFDFPRPEFYNNLFENWGLDKGEVLKW